MVASGTELAALSGLVKLVSMSGDLPRRKLPVLFRRRHRQQNRTAMTAKATTPKTEARMIASFFSLGSPELLDDASGVGFDVGDGLSLVVVGMEVCVDETEVVVDETDELASGL